MRCCGLNSSSAANTVSLPSNSTFISCCNNSQIVSLTPCLQQQRDPFACPDTPSPEGLIGILSRSQETRHLGTNLFRLHERNAMISMHTCRPGAQVGRWLVYLPGGDAGRGACGSSPSFGRTIADMVSNTRIRLPQHGAWWHLGSCMMKAGTGRGEAVNWAQRRAVSRRK